MEIIGITGQTGSGKTTIAQILRKEGFLVLDIDKWCRQMYNDALFLEKIRTNFPSAFENGVFDKRKLRHIVFENQENLKVLESLTHPYLKAKFLKTRRCNAYKNYDIFVDIALLYEMGLDCFCTKIIRACAPFEVKMQRVIKRDNITKDAYKKMLIYQKDDIKDDILVNTNKPLNILKTDILKLVEEIIC